MQQLWNMIINLYSIRFNIWGINVSFLEMTIFFAVLSLLITFIKGVFDE